MLTLTSLLRPIFMKRIKESGNFEKYEDEIQFAQLKSCSKAQPKRNTANGTDSNTYITTTTTAGKSRWYTTKTFATT